MLTPPVQPSHPFGMPHTPFDPATGRYAALGETREIRCFRVLEELADYLKCDDWHGAITYVAKPLMLRRTPFDGNTIDASLYTYTAVDRRTVAGTAEYLVPPYLPDTEFVLAARFSFGVWTPAGSPPTFSQMGDPLGRRILWEDINEAGRTWIPIPAAGAVLWGKAQSNWENHSGNGSLVSVKRCTDKDGLDPVGDEFDVYLPRPSSSVDPNVRSGETIAYTLADDGTPVAVSGYLDDAIGTLKFWNLPAAIPGGWGIVTTTATHIGIYDSSDPDRNAVGFGTNTNAHLGSSTNTHTAHDLDHEHSLVEADPRIIDAGGATYDNLTTSPSWTGAAGAKPNASHEAAHSSSDNRPLTYNACLIQRTN